MFFPLKDWTISIQQHWMLVNGHAEILVVASDKTASISFKLNQSNNNKSQLFYHQKLREPLSIFTNYKTTITPKINILNLF